MKNYIKYHIVLCMITIAHMNHGNNESQLNLLENIAIGGIVGAAEVAMPGQMLSYAMNCAINSQPIDLKRSYAGFTANALGQMPITAMQKVVQVLGSQNLETWQGAPLSESQRIAMSYLAGIAGATIDTPSNAIQLFLQDKANVGKTTRQAILELGMKSFRGFSANAFMKEGIFAVGYQYLAGKATDMVKPYSKEGLVSMALGGSLAGIATAVITQPGAVMRNKMQSDLSRNVSMYKNIGQTMSEIIKQEGCSGLFKGLTARGTRVAIAVPLYVAYTKIIEDKLQQYKQ